MLWVPQKGKILTQHNTGSVGTASPGTSLTTGGAASTKGSAAEIFSSTSFDSYWMKVAAIEYGTPSSASEGTLDILIGAATEEVLIPDLVMGYCGLFGGGLADAAIKTWEFPLYTPAGSRLAARAAGQRTSSTLKVLVWLYGGNGHPPFRVGTKVTTYGIGTVPNATAVTPGLSGAEGAWTEITSATTEDHFAFVPSFQVDNDSAVQNRTFALDLGVGAATEEEIMEGYWFNTGTSEVVEGPLNPFPCFQDVPSGTRLATRLSGSGVAADAYEVAIHAVS